MGSFRRLGGDRGVAMYEVMFCAVAVLSAAFVTSVVRSQNEEATNQSVAITLGAQIVAELSPGVDVTDAEAAGLASHISNVVNRALGAYYVQTSDAVILCIVNVAMGTIHKARGDCGPSDVSEASASCRTGFAVVTRWSSDPSYYRDGKFPPNSRSVTCIGEGEQTSEQVAPTLPDTPPAGTPFPVVAD